MLFFALLLSVLPLHECLSGVVICRGGQLLLLCMPEFMVSAFALVFRCCPSALVFTMSLLCTGGATCLVHYMQVSVASFAQVGPVGGATCRCVASFAQVGPVGALHAGVCGIICTGGASCWCTTCRCLWHHLHRWGQLLVHYMQVSVASFAQVGPVVGALHAGVCGIICTGGASCWCTTCRCLWHHLHWWGQLLVHYMQVSVASFALVGPVVGALHAGVCGIICTGGASCWCTTCRCLWHHLHWWGQLLLCCMQVSVVSFTLVGPLVAVLHAGVYGIICTGRLLHKCLCGGAVNTGGHRGFHSQH